MVVFDTNAIIYYLKKEPSVVSALNRVLFSFQYRPIIASVTELELLSSSLLTSQDIAEIDMLLASLSIVPLHSQIARIGAKLRREYRLKTPDSIVAATALFTNSTLLTRNIKDFKRISGLPVQAV